MAETADMAPTRATSTSAAASPSAAARRAATNGEPRARRRASRAASDDLEAQVAQLQSDLKTITKTLQRLGEEKVGEARATAKMRTSEIREKGEDLIEAAQDEFGAIEKQIKDTIREKPLTAVAGAIALGFILAVVTR